MLLCWATYLDSSHCFNQIINNNFKIKFYFIYLFTFKVIISLFLREYLIVYEMELLQTTKLRALLYLHNTSFQCPSEGKEGKERKGQL